MTNATDKVTITVRENGGQWVATVPNAVNGVFHIEKKGKLSFELVTSRSHMVGLGIIGASKNGKPGTDANEAQATLFASPDNTTMGDMSLKVRASPTGSTPDDLIPISIFLFERNADGGYTPAAERLSLVTGPPKMEVDP